MSASSASPDATAQIAGLIFGVLLIDENLAIVEANPAAEDLLGRSAARLREARLFEVCGPRDQRVAAGLRDSEGQFIARGVTLESGGRELLVNLTASPIATHPGWRVVTLSQAGDRNFGIAENDGETGAPAILAHEIKNPLAAIRGASQLLARRSEPQNRSLAELIGSEVDRIARLIDRMQQLGRQSPEPTSAVNLHEAIRNAMASVRAGRPDGPLLVEEFDPSLPPVDAHGDMLEQVLINLLANACDATGAGEEARVEIRTRFVSGLVIRAIALGRSIKLPIEITVTDNGPGIPADLRERIFQPFVSSKPHGQGLGLALVKKLVSDMGGRIVHLRDDRNGLTHFRINLAVAEAGRA